MWKNPCSGEKKMAGCPITGQEKRGCQDKGAKSDWGRTFTSRTEGLGKNGKLLAFFA